MGELTSREERFLTTLYLKLRLPNGSVSDDPFPLQAMENTLKYPPRDIMDIARKLYADGSIDLWAGGDVRLQVEGKRLAAQIIHDQSIKGKLQLITKYFALRLDAFFWGIIGGVVGGVASALVMRWLKL